MHVQPPAPTDSPLPNADVAPAVRPRQAAPDDFEQNPLSQVSERLTLQAAAGLDDAGRVREAMRIVISEGVPIAEAARRCNVAPSHLAQWREKYLQLLNEAPSIAGSPLMEPGKAFTDADFVRIPKAARDQFADNWARLMEVTRATPASFHQHPVLVFLENSWLTSWLYTEGRLDRAVASGAAVVVLALVLTGSFLFAGRFNRQDDPAPQNVVNYDLEIRRAAAVAREFFAAATAEEKMKHVIAEGPVLQEMEAFFRENPAVAMPGAILLKAVPGRSQIGLEMDVPALQRAHRCIVVSRDGRMLIDWESCSLYQEAHLENLRRKHPVDPVRVTVQVRRDTYYNFEFTGDRFECYQLSYPGLPLDLFGYVQKDSPEAATLRALVQSVDGMDRVVSAVIEVRYPAKNARDNQVEIVRIVSEEWGQAK